MTRSSALRPWQFAPRPDSPLGAFQCLRCERAARLSTPSSATRITLPPSPPSPPSGPPRGTYFSRRKLTQPSPPLPACTWILTRSTNMGDALGLPEGVSRWLSRKAAALSHPFFRRLAAAGGQAREKRERGLTARFYRRPT